MKQVNMGEDAPEFCLPDADENKVCLRDFRGKWVVLYFYPKDNTSGCTLEAVDFTRSIEDFKKMNTEILGMSPDSSRSHCAFRDKHGLKVTLLSDPEHHVLKQYGVWILKKMYGREYYGVERSTFLINTEGKVAFVWRKVKANGHVEDVLKKLGEIQRG
jgi:peroxiredoxin Q/BCP